MRRAAALLVLISRSADALAPPRGFVGGRTPPPRTSFSKGAYEKREFFYHEIIHQSTRSASRAGRLHTPHGIVDTPGFVAVATNAALKGLDMKSAIATGQQLVCANSYHLMLQPGSDVIEQAGGIHKFMRHNGPVITDSGGFQIFSLAQNSVHSDVGELSKSRSDDSVCAGDSGNDYYDGSCSSEPLLPPPSELKRAAPKGGGSSGSVVKVSEQGVVFRSYRDGRHVSLTPEGTVQAQKQYGSDIIIPLDEVRTQREQSLKPFQAIEPDLIDHYSTRAPLFSDDCLFAQLPPFHTSPEKLLASVLLSHRWEERSLREHLKDVKGQAMYATGNLEAKCALLPEISHFILSNRFMCSAPNHNAGACPLPRYGVVHGGIDKDLRQLSVDYLTALPFDGFAVGGSLGSCHEELVDLLAFVVPKLPKDKPNHLLGIADERSIHAAVPLGKSKLRWWRRGLDSDTLGSLEGSNISRCTS